MLTLFFLSIWIFDSQNRFHYKVLHTSLQNISNDTPRLNVPIPKSIKKAFFRDFPKCVTKTLCTICACTIHIVTSSTYFHIYIFVSYLCCVLTDSTHEPGSPFNPPCRQFFMSDYNYFSWQKQPGSTVTLCQNFSWTTMSSFALNTWAFVDTTSNVWSSWSLSGLDKSFKCPRNVDELSESECQMTQ